MTLLTALERSLTTIIVAIGVPLIPYGARTVRASALSLKESQSSGGMLAEALTLLMFAPHVAIAPGVFITLTVFAFNMLGDSLRDVMDPRLRGKGAA